MKLYAYLTHLRDVIIKLLRSARSEIFIEPEPANESQAPLGAQSLNFISLLKGALQS